MHSQGHDVAFSIDHFEKCKVTSWEGVRNHEAKKILKVSSQSLNRTPCFYIAPFLMGILLMLQEKIKVGHEALIYHSNCEELIIRVGFESIADLFDR